MDVEGRAFYATGLIALVIALTAAVVGLLTGPLPGWARVLLLALLAVGVLGIGLARSGIGPMLTDWWRRAPIHHPPPGRRSH